VIVTVGFDDCIVTVGAGNAYSGVGLGDGEVEALDDGEGLGEALDDGEAFGEELVDGLVVGGLPGIPLLPPHPATAAANTRTAAADTRALWRMENLLGKYSMVIAPVFGTRRTGN
jgi:hypothetical protein